MSYIYRASVFFLIILLVTACTAPIIGTASTSILSKAEIVRYPTPADFSGNYLKLTFIPKFNPNSTDPWQIDLRSRDLTEIDMAGSLSDLESVQIRGLSHRAHRDLRVFSQRTQ